MPVEVTFIIPSIQNGFIKRCLETLKEYTPVEHRVIVIDNNYLSIEEECRGLYNLWIRSYRNLGFSKSMNLGIQLSQTPYIGLVNDDVEFLNTNWWQGIMDTFRMDEKIIAVNPNTPTEGAWGYGLRSDNQDTWVPKDGFVYDGDRSVAPVIDGVEINTPDLARKHYDDLINKHPIWQKDTLCDGFALTCGIFKRESLKELGLLDERFYPGGGEDYDMMCRGYSKKYRMVGTTKSWVWHWWGKSKDDISGKDPTNKLFESRPRWNDLGEVWGDEFDVWGHRNLPDGTREPLRRLAEPLVDDL